MALLFVITLLWVAADYMNFKLNPNPFWASQPASYGPQLMIQTAVSMFLGMGFLITCLFAHTVFTFFGIWLFTSTRRRYRASSAQLWRILAYSVTANVILCGLVTFIAAAYRCIIVSMDYFDMVQRDANFHNFLSQTVGVVVLLLAAHWLMSLRAAGRIYLQFDHWWVVLMSSQIISILIVLNASLRLGLIY
jgi:hypothetical protein